MRRRRKHARIIAWRLLLLLGRGRILRRANRRPRIVDLLVGNLLGRRFIGVIDGLLPVDFLLGRRRPVRSFEGREREALWRDPNASLCGSSLHPQGEDRSRIDEFPQRVSHRTVPQSLNTCPQSSAQSPPETSVTRPSFSKNLLGTWNMASIRPPSGVQATWRVPASRQTNSPGPTVKPFAGPSLSPSLPSST